MKYLWIVKFCVILFLLMTLTIPLGAQEVVEPEVPTKTQIQPNALLFEYLDRELTRITDAELRAWARSLEISQDGSIQTLKESIRSYFKNLSLQPVIQIEPKETANQTQDQDQDQDQAEGNQVAVDQAGMVEYVTLGIIDERFIFLRDDARVRVTDSKTGVVHLITAETIIINQDTNTLSARGDVTYLKKSSTQEETFNGSELWFDSSTSEIYLLDGNAVIATGGNNQDIQSGTLYRGKNDLTILRDLTLTSSVWDPALYSVRAQKLFILQDGEWFIQGAVLYLGHVPTFWFPAFFHPGDSIVFNPVTGFRDREGAFLQTTTYLQGTKELKDPFFDLLKITKPESGTGQYIKELEGIYLRNTGQKSSNLPPNQTISKLLIDYYSKLGAYLGFELSSKSTKDQFNIDIAGGLGFTNNLYTQNGSISPYYLLNGIPTVVPSRTIVFGMELPLRFYIDLSSTVQVPGGNLDIKLPIYSDPEARSDFAVRTEDIDWSKVLGITPESSTGTTATTTAKTNLDWRLTFTAKDALLKSWGFIDSLKIDTISTSLLWERVANSDIKPEESAATSASIKTQFVPRTLTLPNFRGSAQGTIFKYPRPQVRDPSPTTTDPTSQKTTVEGGAILPPWVEIPIGEEEKNDSTSPGILEVDGESSFLSPDFLLVPALPNSAQSQPSIGEVNITWNTNPLVDVQGKFFTTLLPDQDSWLYEPEYWLGSYTLPGRIQTNGKFLSGLLTFSATTQLQSRISIPFLWNELASSTKKEQETLRNYETLALRTDQTVNVTLKPFSEGIFAASTLAYDASGIIWNRKFTKILDGVPLYEDVFFDGTEETLSVHKLKSDIRSTLETWNQTVSLETRIPPLKELSSIKYQTDFSLPFLSLSGGTGVRWEDGKVEPVLDPLVLQANLRPIPGQSTYQLSQTLTSDLEALEFTRYDANLTIGFFQAGLTMSKNTRLSLDPVDRVIKPEGGAVFQIENFRGSLKLDQTIGPFWGNRIQGSITAQSQFQQNLVDIRNSSLTNSLTAQLQIHDFAKFYVNYSSSNRKMYRYFPFYEDRLGAQPINVIQDLLKSLDIFNEDNLRSTAFKLSAIETGINHYLGDWQLDLGFKARPKEAIIDNKRTYTWDTDFSFALAWKPLPILDKKGQIANDVFTLK